MLASEQELLVLPRTTGSVHVVILEALESALLKPSNWCGLITEKSSPTLAPLAPLGRFLTLTELINIVIYH